MKNQHIDNLDPNPGFGQTSWFDQLFMAIGLVVGVPWVLVCVLIRRLVLQETNGCSFKGDLYRSLGRYAQALISPSLSRALTLRSLDQTLQSPRFHACKSDLFQRILRGNFAGYWICSGAPGLHQAPSACDLVIYHIHGGAYQSGHPAMLLATYLRVAEIAAEKGISIAVFCLNYSLAPEAKYPTQVQQAIAGYKYLLEEKAVSSSKLAFHGDSAGGHLALCLLAELAKHQLPRPEAGVFLMAPWVDLLCSSDASFARNKYKDYLVREYLIAAGKSLFTPEQDFPYKSFRQPLPDRLSWSKVMPSRVWVSVGDNDLLFEDVLRFCEILSEDGVVVDIEIAEGKVHTWQLLQDNLDTANYVATTESALPDGLMSGAANVAHAILAHFLTKQQKVVA